MGFTGMFVAVVMVLAQVQAAHVERDIDQPTRIVHLRVTFK
jgi:hypothetical protein